MILAKFKDNDVTQLAGNRAVKLEKNIRNLGQPIIERLSTFRYRLTWFLNVRQKNGEYRITPRSCSLLLPHETREIISFEIKEDMNAKQDV